MQSRIFYCFLFTAFLLRAETHYWNAESYDKNSLLQYRIGVEAIESFNLQGNEKVLDIGCGNGKITALCASKLNSGYLTAIDYSPSMIEFAQKNYGNVPNLQFVLQDVTTMSFDAEFDLVYSIFCLHWVKDQETAMNNIARSLKPGGKAVLYISLPNNFNETFKKEFYTLINSPEWNSYRDILAYNHYSTTQEQWVDYAEQNNLSVNFRAIEDKVIYSYEKFRERVVAYGICYDIIQTLGQERGNRFVDELLQNFYQQLGLNKNQPITWASNAAVLTLTKKID